MDKNLNNNDLNGREAQSGSTGPSMQQSQPGRSDRPEFNGNSVDAGGAGYNEQSDKPNHQNQTEAGYQSGPGCNGSGYENSPDYSGNSYQNGSDYNGQNSQNSFGYNGQSYQNGTGYNGQSYQNGTGYNNQGYQNATGYNNQGYQNGTGYNGQTYQNGPGLNGYGNQGGQQYSNQPGNYGNYNYQNQFQYGQGYQPPAPKKNGEGYAVGSMVCGIGSLLFCACYGLPGIVLGIVAIVLYRCAKNENDGIVVPFARAGQICGIVGVAFGVLWLIYYLFVFFVVIFEIGSAPNYYL